MTFYEFSTTFPCQEKGLFFKTVIHNLSRLKLVLTNYTYKKRLLNV